LEWYGQTLLAGPLGVNSAVKLAEVEGSQKEEAIAEGDTCWYAAERPASVSS
jgi:hypothetical protein